MCVSVTNTNQQDAEDPFFSRLPFDVGIQLSEPERRAKANVLLPYVKAQDQRGS